MPVVRRADLVAPHPQEYGQAAGRVDVVINDQDAKWQIGMSPHDATSGEGSLGLGHPCVDNRNPSRSRSPGRIPDGLSRSRLELKNRDLVMADGVGPVACLIELEVVDVHRHLRLRQGFLAAGVAEEQEAVGVAAGADQPITLGVELQTLDHATPLALGLAEPLSLAPD